MQRSRIRGDGRASVANMRLGDEGATLLVVSAAGAFATKTWQAAGTAAAGVLPLAAEQQSESLVASPAVWHGGATSQAPPQEAVSQQAAAAQGESTRKRAMKAVAKRTVRIMAEE